MVKRWDIFELSLNGPASGNPFIDVMFGASFKNQNRVIHVDGFYGRCRVNLSGKPYIALRIRKVE